MKHSHYFLIAILGLSLAGCEVNKPENQQLLFNPKDHSLENFETGKDAKIALVKDEKGKEVLQLICVENSKAPWIILNDKSGSWKLAGKNYLAADITNIGENEALVELRLDANGWSGQGKVLSPGQTRTVKLVIPQNNLPDYYQKKIIGIYNLPDGIIKSDRDPNTIHKLSFIIDYPVKESKLLISNIRAEGEVKYPSKEQVDKDFFPLVDEFGQYVGRVDGENFSCGFLNICDRPHAEMVNASRKIGNEIYKQRYQ